MAQTEKPRERAVSTDQKPSWSWKRFFGKDDGNAIPAPSQEEDTTRPGLARRISRKVVPGLPRAGTFKRQQSELRDKLEPVVPDERRALSVDRRRNLSGRASSLVAAALSRLSAPELLDTSEAVDPVVEEPKIPVQSPAEDEAQDYVDISKDASAMDSQSISTEAFDEMILEELEKRWILNLSMHFRDKSKREKFFVTFAETPTHWRRVTVSLDYRDAPAGSLEEELVRTKFQRDKSARIYESIRESLPDIQFYDTVTNLKLQTENDRLHVHVVEDVSEIIQYPPVRAIHHLNCRRIRENELVFDSHLSGFVYKVQVNGETFIKKEIPGPDTVDEFLYEINALHQLSGSRSVIQFGGVVLDNRGEFVKGLLISYAEQGALIDVIYDGEGNLPWRRRERWAREIVQGLSEIHEAGFVQGDFTLSNIVIDARDSAKIIDINRRGCPVGWEPPEVRDLIESNQRISMYIGVKSDLFQLGMVLYALAAQHDEPETQRPLKLATLPVDIPDYFLDICHRCLDDDPRRRLQASALLKLFPEMEDSLYEESGPIPIVIDAQHVDEMSFSNVNGHYRSGIHSPPYSSSGMDRSINVHDYAVTDVSDDPDFYPRRGRSPPAPYRTGTAGIAMPFSDASIPFLEAHIPLPRTSILAPELYIPLPESSTPSECTEDTPDPYETNELVEITSHMVSSPNGLDCYAEQAPEQASSSTGFDSVDFAIRPTPTSYLAPHADGFNSPSQQPLEVASVSIGYDSVDPTTGHNSTHPTEVVSTFATKLNIPESEHVEPSVPQTGYQNVDTSIQDAQLATKPPRIDLVPSEPHCYHKQEPQPAEGKMDQPCIPKTEKPRPTVALPEFPELYSDLAGVGVHHSNAHFEIPPAASLDDDLTTEMHLNS